MEFKYKFNSSSEYTFKRRLGTGGSADVFLYTRKVSGLPDQDVVLKIFKGQESKIHELINEGKFLTSLNHPNILTTFGYERMSNNSYALVLEYVNGQNLGEIIQKFQNEDRMALTAYIIGAVCEGLKEAHLKNIVHGDISARNILISENGSVKLSDFGLSRNTDSLNELDFQKGTLDYLAPERWEGAPTSKSTDIYALGVLAYEILSGVNLLRDKHELKIERFKEFNDFLKKVLSRDPEKRGELSGLIPLLPKFYGGSKKVIKYIKSNGALENYFQTSTMTFFPKRKFKFTILKPILICFLLVTSIATGIDHSIGLERSRPSYLTVTSLPWGEIFVDGQSVGYTPILNLPIKSGYHVFLWKDHDGFTVTRTMMDYGNGIYAYQIIKNKGRPVVVAPLMHEQKDF